MRNLLRLVFDAGRINGWRVLSFPQPAATETTIDETATKPLLLALQAWARPAP